MGVIAGQLAPGGSGGYLDRGGGLAAARLADVSERPPPHVQMREQLARRRRAGVPFDMAWEAAYARIRWPHENPTRRQHKEALLGAKEEWRAAYEQRETPLSRALRAVTEEPPAEEARESGGGVLAA